MKLFLGLLVVGLLVLRRVNGDLDPQGVKCGQKRCSTMEYCSPYDTHCRPCSEACDTESRNYQPKECATDCQEYLHDQRYVLRSELGQYEDLRAEIGKLWILFKVAITLTCLSILAVLYLMARAFVPWEKISGAFQRTFARQWVKKATTKNRVEDDAEVGGAKQNGLKLTMPTISATVAPSRSTATNGNGTPNTTSTPLSRRHPSEDTTLDYAYDNPAMTPSPEAAQLRTKRESSF